MSLILPPVQVGPVLWDFSRTYIFGVINVTPDSFSDGGNFSSVQEATDYAKRLIDAGADAIDIGGESTRPGSVPVPVEEELRRVMPVVERLVPECPVPISIDTYKAEVARRALRSGATFVNDVSGMRIEPAMAEAVAEEMGIVILGHLRGRPATMQQEIVFENVVAEVADELKTAVRTAVSAGIPAPHIWIDPGIGFGKTAEQSLQLLKHVGEVRREVGYPLMVGPSRKSFIGAVTGQPASERVVGTAVATAAVITEGADAVRLHDVKELLPAVRLADAIHRGRIAS